MLVLGIGGMVIVGAGLEGIAFPVGEERVAAGLGMHDGQFSLSASGSAWR